MKTLGDEHSALDRETAVNLARVVLKHSRDDDEAKELLAMLIGPSKVWTICPTCGRRYETDDAYRQGMCGRRNTWGAHGLPDPSGR